MSQLTQRDSRRISGHRASMPRGVLNPARWKAHSNLWKSRQHSLKRSPPIPGVPARFLTYGRPPAQPKLAYPRAPSSFSAGVGRTPQTVRSSGRS
jgi:hypothetical protein